MILLTATKKYIGYCLYLNLLHILVVAMLEGIPEPEV